MYKIHNTAIHQRYRIYPINYIAYDMLHHTDEYNDKYTPEEVTAFEAYITKQLEKVDLPQISEEDYEYMRTMMLTMYSNPLKNQLAALNEDVAKQ